MLDEVSLEPEDEADRYLIEARRQTASAREFVAEAPDWQTRLLVLATYEVRRWQRSLFRPEAVARRQGMSPNRLLGRMGWAAVASAPAAWAVNAFTHYVGLWGLFEWLDAGASRRYADYVRRSDRIPVYGSLLKDWPSHPMAWPGRLLMAAAFAASVVSAVLAVWRRWRYGSRRLDSGLVAAALAGLLVQGHFLAVGLFGIAQGRYTLAMWPFSGGLRTAVHPLRVS